jgi:hypothetical protein
MGRSRSTTAGDMRRWKLMDSTMVFIVVAFSFGLLYALGLRGARRRVHEDGHRRDNDQPR